MINEKLLIELASGNLDYDNQEDKIFLLLINLAFGEMRNAGVVIEDSVLGGISLDSETEKILRDISREIPIDFNVVNFKNSSNSQIKEMISYFENFLSLQINEYNYIKNSDNNEIINIEEFKKLRF